MLGRLIVLVAAILLGSLAIEVHFYHPEIALERDPVAMVPVVVAAAGLGTGFLLLAFRSPMTLALFAALCLVAVLTGVAGTAIHLAIHAPSFHALVSNRRFWLGNPAPLVPLSFSVGGGLGLVPLVCRELRPERSVSLAGSFLELLGALASILAAVAATNAENGLLALLLVLAGLGLGGLGYIVELAEAFGPLLLSLVRERMHL